MCGRNRPHERFGGRGYAASVCSDCRQRPKAEQQRILATDEVLGFLEQSNISAKNIQRLEALATIADARFQALRQLVLDIARVKPHKRRRWGFLRERFPELYRRSVELEMIDEIECFGLDQDADGNGSE